MSDEAANILRDMARHIGFTVDMLRSHLNVKEETILRMVSPTSDIGQFSKLLRECKAKISIPNCPPKIMRFELAALVKTMKSPVWRSRHGLFSWPNNQKELIRLCKLQKKRRTSAQLAGDLNSQLIPGPETRWTEATVNNAVYTDVISYHVRDDASLARYVVFREITTSFPSPKFPDFVSIDATTSPILMRIKPAPAIVQRLLIEAAVRIDGFCMDQTDVGKTDPHELNDGLKPAV